MLSGKSASVVFIVGAVLVIGACAAMAAGAIMTSTTLKEMIDHCSASTTDCTDKVEKELPYVYQWCQFFAGFFLAIGGLAALGVVITGVRLYRSNKKAAAAALA